MAPRVLITRGAIYHRVTTVTEEQGRTVADEVARQIVYELLNDLWHALVFLHQGEPSWATWEQVGSWLRGDDVEID